MEDNNQENSQQRVEDPKDYLQQEENNITENKEKAESYGSEVAGEEDGSREADLSVQGSKTMEEIEKEKHQKKIKRLKNFILTVFFALLIIPAVLCILGIFRLQGMQRQIDVMEQKLEEITLGLEQMPAEEAGDTEETVELPLAEAVSVNEADSQEDASLEGKRKICLSFDDGPSGNTDAILEILAAYDVKATFFVTGKTGYTEQYQHIVEQGHTIGMHSYSHDYSVLYQDIESFAEDFYAIRDYIKEVTGVDCKYYRFPGGSSNTVSDVDMRQCIAFLEEQEVSYVDWNISSEDAAGATTVDEVVENVINQIENSQAETLVVLMHDSADKNATVEALPQLIEKIQEMDGVALVPLEDGVNLVQHVALEEDEREEVFQDMHDALGEVDAVDTVDAEVVSLQ